MSAHARRIGIPLLTGALALALGCDPMEEDVDEDAGIGAELLEPPEPAGDHYTAELAPVNEELLESTPEGTADLTMTEDSLIVEVRVTGVPPEMMHLQHVHGFADGTPAKCPGIGADANDDGVVDVTETAEAAGTTMVPFHADPLSMEIQAESYPRAGADGAYTYRQAVPLDALRAAFEEEFGTRDLALEDRAVFVHGVPADTDLPESAGSVPGVPAHVTLPILCGDLTRGP